jgi:glutathione peroxidase
MAAIVYEYVVKDSKSQDFSFAQLKGKVILIVNVASKCGFTPQYKGLEKLYLEKKDKGFTIIGFPCNQFGAQEPGTDQEIQTFCELNYGVTFPIMSKIEVNGTNEAPIYKFLKSNAPGILGTEAIKWNFTKFLIGKDGKVIHRYAPNTEPKDIASDIEEALK